MISEFVSWLILFSSEMIDKFGYFGVAVAGFTSSLSIVLPIVPAQFLIFFAAPRFNPVLMAIFAAFGSALGEIVGYYFGYGGGKFLRKKYKKDVIKAEKSLKDRGAFVTVFLFSALPLPTDVAGIVCGAVKYPLKRFFIASFLGKIIKFLVICFSGYYGLDFALKLFGF